MKLVKTGLMLTALLALGACEGRDIFGGGAGAGNNNGVAQTPGGPIAENSLEYFATEIGDRVLFLVNEATLGAEAKRILDAQVTWLNRYPDRTVVVEGHADEQGTREYNLALGARRAAAVRNYMVSAGLLETRLSIISYGKERPLEVCSNEACWSQNRRAVTVVAGGLGSV
ncbi:MAG: peptidoglycan-associated lipoprotein Pal [Rhodobacteraceae bacterium]|nr:peptidoglycan-associated lipoprotein Pal [Paracoccaceae bacterium]